jgi:hypothetical protein
MLSPSSPEICAVEMSENMLDGELFVSKFASQRFAFSLIFVRSEIRIHAGRLDYPAANFVSVSLR